MGTEMNIRTASATLEQARTALHNGDLFTAASLGLAAQRQAKQCTARAADDVAFSGHTIAVVQASQALKTEADQGRRSELGRVRAESYFLFRAP